ncbi:HD domain-containing protein [Clostridium saccharoperbutylacetonicum]|uniref:HD domain-containing protein n=1 Tax=Clostridium saccharoperbutylacetonicum TaxID=36745 RepID=UPI000983F0F7|nr:HD domain-containing protein [Clostridium saccharoperbutylacetonicum]AQR95675.1 HD domain protein [Clostridium saccharoperbutylacetonicum]NSB31538.1 putative nucleotidyltransferase with HDIG domain [Clostridium saccharoperbutylacetonicum]
MEKDSLKKYYNWFNSYIKKFYGDDPVINQNIELKEKHTLNVANHAVSIAKSLNLTGEEINTAEIIGLFHDIGRFEQFRTYKTFRDYLSVNHAALGVKILVEYDVLKYLDKDRQKLIIKAINLHNEKDLPKDLNVDEALFCKLIRDADKLDIFRIITEYEEERRNNPNPALDNLPFTPGYNKELLQAILTNKKINNNSLKNYNDRKLYELNWITDLNYAFSVNYIKEKNILKILTDCLPKNDEIDKISKYLEKYIEGFLKEEKI